MSESYRQRQQQSMNAEIARNAAREEARRDALAEIRRGEQEQREEQRQADAANPVLQGFLREAEYKRYAAEMDAEQERQRLDTERTAKHNAELRDLYEAELRIWTVAQGQPAATFGSDRWPAVLARYHADTNAATDAEREKLIRQSSVF